jgi:signal peptidase I
MAKDDKKEDQKGELKSKGPVLDKGATGKKGKSEKKRAVRETIEAILIAVFLALFIRAFVIQAFKIPSGSMEDTLLVGDHLIVSKFAYGIQMPKPAMIKVMGVTVPFFSTTLINTWGSVERGDIIVFRFPGDRHKDYIKRAIALPGETVEVRNRVIYINGQKIDDPYGVHKVSGYEEVDERANNFGPYKVPEGHVFAMGDNREKSYDSRFWGPVPIKEIKGKAFIIYWSWDGSKKRVRGSRIGNIIH